MSAGVGGSKEKQKNADKGGEGVQNPENFADVLYVWSQTPLVSLAAVKLLVQQTSTSIELHICPNAG